MGSDETNAFVQVDICDDHLQLATKVEQEILQLNIPNLAAEVFGSGEDLMRSWKEGLRGQILFLDIEMPGLSGIEIARRVREEDKHAVIIFMSSHHEYVFEVFDVSPFRFLRKPLDDDEVKKVLVEALGQLKQTGQYFFFQIKRTRYQIPYHEILYFEGSGRKVIVHTVDGDYSFYGKISTVMNQMDKEMFCQIHASYAVNMDQVRSVSDSEVSMFQGEILPISKARREATRKQHMRYVFLKGGME